MSDAASGAPPQATNNLVVAEGGEVYLTPKGELKAASFPKLIELLTRSSTGS